MTVVKTVKANGVELAYAEAGAGAPVVLVHGSLCDYRYSLPVMQRLAARFRVINYSRRCHVPNACPPGAPYSYELHADDLAAVIRTLRLGPAHVVGHSYGGAVAALTAQKHPELVRSLVLIEPGLYSLLPMNDYGLLVRGEMAAAGERARSALAHDLDEEAIRQLMDSVLHPRRFDDLAPEMRVLLLENAPSLRASVVTSAPLPQFTCEGAKQLGMPVLLMGGEKSAPQFPLVNGELARCLLNAHSITIPGADHGLYYDAAGPVSAAILKFLAQLKE